jgi:hypothetical protein
MALPRDVTAAAMVTPSCRAIRTELGQWCEQAATRLLAGPSCGFEGAPLIGAALLCVHLFRALSDMISIHCSFSTAKERAQSVARKGGVFLSVTIHAAAFPTGTIDSTFMKGCRTLAMLQLPLMSDGAAPMHVGDWFCGGCVRLDRITLAALACVTHVGNCFLFGCSSLGALDLTPLAAVTHVGNCFLSGCRSLGALDLTPLAAVTQVGNCFLSGCRSLGALDLTPLAGVTQVGHSFLADCWSLGSLDLTPLAAVTHVGNCFLSGCSSLGALDLTPIAHAVLVVSSR